MNDLPGMKILPVLLLMAVTLLTGCSAANAEQRARSQVESLLNPDGMEYSITGKEAWKMTRNDIEGMFARAAKESSDPVASRYFASLKFFFRLMMNFSGVDSILCTGRSSELITGNIVHEKIALVYDPAGAGVINTFFNMENSLDPRRLFGEIPENTVISLAADMRLLALPEVLKDYGDFADMLASCIPAGFPVKEILESCDGIWKLHIFDLDSKNLVFKLDIPDKNSTVFDIFALLTRRPKVETKLNIAGLGVVKKDGKRVIFYIGKDCEKLSEKLPSATLPPEKAVLLTGLPEKAVLFGFADMKCLPEELKGFKLGGVKFPSPVEDKVPSVIALARLPEKNGYFAVENGNGSILSCDISLFLEVIMPFLQDVKIPSGSGKKDQNPEESVSGNTPAVKENCSCAGVLTGAAEVLKNFPDTATGFYRLEAGSFFPAEAGKYDVVLFNRDCGDSAYLPLMITRPHQNGFCVSAGKDGVKSYQLAKPESFRRIIGFLHTVYKFDEKVFRQLIALAGEFDRKRGSENDR